MPAISLDDYVTEVTRLVSEASDVGSLVEAIRPLKARLLESADLLPESFREGLDEVPYTRNLLHADPEGRFVVMALVWREGAETPVHDHHTWGVVGCYDREMEVVNFSAPNPEDGHLDPEPKGRLGRGEVVGIVPPRELNIHKMLNHSGGIARTIHTYGDPARICRVYDPETGRATDCRLKFHHQLG